jgi:hypothetical protein
MYWGEGKCQMAILTLAPIFSLYLAAALLHSPLPHHLCLGITGYFSKPRLKVSRLSNHFKGQNLYSTSYLIRGLFKFWVITTSLAVSLFEANKERYAHVLW